MVDNMMVNMEDVVVDMAGDMANNMMDTIIVNNNEENMQKDMVEGKEEVFVDSMRT